MSRRLSISIAMCTYNGERFLQEQLDSFLRQTRLPDELVVCDDGSQDATVELLKSFAARAPFPVHIFLNPQNLGYGKNFEKAASLCGGDIIAFSDQDDVWLPEKLAKFEQVFLDYPQIGYAFCDAAIVDEALQPLGYSAWNVVGLSLSMPNLFSPGEFTYRLVSRPALILGSTICVRIKLCDILLPLPPYWFHDTWIPFAGSAIMGVALIPEQLNKFRQHSSQCFGMKRSKIFDKIKSYKKFERTRYANRATMWEEALSRIRSDDNLNIDKAILANIKDKIKHLQIRAEIPRSRLLRFPAVLKEIMTGRYHRFSYGFRSIVKDLLL